MRRIFITAVMLTLCTGGLYAAQRTVTVINGEKITAEELTKRLWWQHAAQDLTGLVDEKLLLQEAKRLGVKADEKQMDERFAALQANYKDRADFEKNLKSVGWTDKDLKDLISDQLAIRAAVIADGNLAVTDADAKAFFDKNRDKLGAPEAAELSQIFVNDKAEADDAYELLTSVGADFAKLSALKSADANLRKNSGNLGYISKGMLQPEIEKAVFALKPGEYTKPMATGSGWSIFKLDALRPAKPADFDAVKGNLKAALLDQKIARELPLLTDELRKKAKIEIVK